MPLAYFSNLQAPVRFASSLLNSHQYAFSKILRGKFCSSSIKNIQISNENVIYAGDQRLEQIIPNSIIVKNNFVSEIEENNLVKDVQKYLHRLPYEKAHWDDAISDFREIEHKHWNINCKQVIERLKNKTLEESTVAVKLLPLIHVLDLNENGFIKSHVDSVKTSRNLSSAVVVRNRELSPHVGLVDETRKVFVKENNVESDEQFIVDRNNCCPILVRMFYTTTGVHEPLASYSKGRLPQKEVQVNTWPDVSLGELAQQLRYECREARRRGSKLHFASVYVSKRRIFKRKPLGMVITGLRMESDENHIKNVEKKRHRSRSNSSSSSDREVVKHETSALNSRLIKRSDDRNIRLNMRNFIVGDYIDVAITEPAQFNSANGHRRISGKAFNDISRNDVKKRLY